MRWYYSSYSVFIIYKNQILNYAEYETIIYQDIVKTLENYILISVNEFFGLLRVRTEISILNLILEYFRL